MRNKSELLEILMVRLLEITMFRGIVSAVLVTFSSANEPPPLINDTVPSTAATLSVNLDSLSVKCDKEHLVS